jgi:hypothetical protein
VDAGCCRWFTCLPYWNGIKHTWNCGVEWWDRCSCHLQAEQHCAQPGSLLLWEGRFGVGDLETEYLKLIISSWNQARAFHTFELYRNQHSCTNSKTGRFIRHALSLRRTRVKHLPGAARYRINRQPQAEAPLWGNWLTLHDGIYAIPGAPGFSHLSQLQKVKSTKESVLIRKLFTEIFTIWIDDALILKACLCDYQICHLPTLPINGKNDHEPLDFDMFDPGNIQLQGCCSCTLSRKIINYPALQGVLLGVIIIHAGWFLDLKTLFLDVMDQMQKTCRQRRCPTKLQELHDYIWCSWRAGTCSLSRGSAPQLRPTRCPDRTRALANDDGVAQGSLATHVFVYFG